LLTPWCRRLRDDGQGCFFEGEADGFEEGDASSSCGFDDGSDIGIEVGAPLGARAVGDFAEDDGGAQCLLGAVVGRRNVAIGDEDEQVLAEALDDALELLAGLGGGHDLEQRIEFALETAVIGDQRRADEAVAAAADADGPLQQGDDTGCQGVVAAVDGVLDVALEVSEADLMLLGRPSHLGAEAIGDPEVGTDVAEEFLDDLLAARGTDDKAGGIPVMEDPGPEGPLADAGSASSPATRARRRTSRWN